MIDCIILAGGLGTRLRSTLPDIPKPLAPIRGTPFLDLLLKQIKEIERVSKVILAVGYRADQIIDHYKDSVQFSIETTPLGTGGAIKKALALATTDHVLVMNGDTFLDLDFKAFWEQHQRHDADITLACIRVEECGRYGTVRLDDSSKIDSFTSSEGPGWINGGAYLIKRSLFEMISFPDAFSLEQDAFPLFLEKKMYAYCSDCKFIDIGTHDSFILAQEIL